MNIYIAKNQKWYTCINVGLKVHHDLETAPTHQSVSEATRFLARNVSLSWQVKLGFLFLFFRSYSGRWTSSGRPRTRRRCSCWRGASLWTCTRWWSGADREKGLLQDADRLKAETKQRCRDIFVGGDFSSVLFTAISIKQLLYFWLRGCFCTVAVSASLYKNEIVKWWMTGVRTPGCHCAVFVPDNGCLGWSDGGTITPCSWTYLLINLWLLCCIYGEGSDHTSSK